MADKVNSALLSKTAKQSASQSEAAMLGAYKYSKSFYDDAITQSKWWSKLYFKLLWGGIDDNEIARRVLSWIPDDFNGRMLDVPVVLQFRAPYLRTSIIRFSLNDSRHSLNKFVGGVGSYYLCDG